VIKWERPMLISLSGVAGVQGQESCDYGSSASSKCFTGNAALTGCSNGNAPGGSYCSAGTGDTDD
jgi:hypothetical protein